MKIIIEILAVLLINFIVMIIAAIAVEFFNVTEWRKGYYVGLLTMSSTVIVIKFFERF